MTVPVAGGKIHFDINIRGILAQDLIHETHGFHEFPPVHRSQKPQTDDTVAHGNLVSRLLLTFHLDEIFNGLTVFGKLLLYPGQRQCQSRALSLQLTGHFRNKGAGNWRFRTDHIGDFQKKIFGSL